METKAVLEENGWQIVHGIVDSVWVTPSKGEEQTSLSALVSEISEEVEIRLEHEAHCYWIAFVPLRDLDAGALTKYFGKVTGEDEYTYRGIECRQRSTPSYIDEAQKALIRMVDESRDLKAVCEESRSVVSTLWNSFTRKCTRHENTAPVWAIVTAAGSGSRQKGLR